MSAELYNELHLWASVLELAVRDYYMGNDKLMWNAARWIFEPSPEGQFNTFENLCHTLDLDPEAVRDKLKLMNKTMYGQYVVSLQHQKRAIAYK